MQLSEFEDFAWFPHSFRDVITDYLVTVHHMLGTPNLSAPLIEKAFN